MTDLEQIAKGLTRAQREALLRSAPEKMHRDHVNRISTYGDEQTGVELFHLGFTTRSGTFSKATPLGLALRNHLLQKEQGR